MRERKLPHDHGEITERVLDRMPEDACFSEASAAFGQLCDVSRLRIFWLLCHCEECGVNIASAVGMTAAAVSHHLKSLRLHGLITGRREGKEVYYTLADTAAARLVHEIVDDFFRMTCPSVGSGKHAESET